MSIAKVLASLEFSAAGREQEAFRVMTDPDMSEHFREEMRDMYRDDARDFRTIADCVEKGKWKDAYHYWGRMDTAAREHISNYAYNYIYQRAFKL